MTKYRLIFANGESEIHFSGANQDDYALCGQDISGDDIDERGRYENANTTKEKVNCKHCIRIVEHCKKIKSSEYEK